MGASDCRNICRRNPTGEPVFFNLTAGARTPYQSGWKKCIVCEITIQTGRLRCLCCGNAYRSKPQKNRARYYVGL